MPWLVAFALAAESSLSFFGGGVMQKALMVRREGCRLNSRARAQASSRRSLPYCFAYLCILCWVLILVSLPPGRIPFFLWLKPNPLPAPSGLPRTTLHRFTQFSAALNPIPRREYLLCLLCPLSASLFFPSSSSCCSLDRFFHSIPNGHYKAVSKGVIFERVALGHRIVIL